MDKIKIDVWSDVVCPFCYLGKAKLEQAIRKLGLDGQTEIEWHSFQLDPGFPKNTSLPSSEYLMQRKGMPLAQLQTSQQRLTDQGENYGIQFDFIRAVNFNTFDAHRLLHWSKAFGKGPELKAALLKAHFTQGADQSKTENLIGILESVGLDAAKGKEVLTSESYTEEVQLDIDLARQIKISGVPFFVFNQKTAISGAQSDDVFEEVLREASV